MRRVPEVIDTWYDSGSMPFAQFHYPFEGSEEFERASRPTTSARRSTRPAAGSTRCSPVRPCCSTAPSYLNCVCLGLILDPEGQKMSKSRGNVVDPWEVIDAHGADAFRWYYLTAQQPWAGYRFSTETVGEAVRQFLIQLWNTYSFWVLYANAEGTGPGAIAATVARRQRQSSIAGSFRGCRRRSDRARAAGRLRLHHGRPGDRRLRRRALELVRAPRGGASGRATRRVRDAPPLPGRGREAARAVHAVHRRRDLPQPRRRRDRDSVRPLPTSPSRRGRRDPGARGGRRGRARAIELGRAARAARRR